jgi:lactoylglutathione lyase
MKFAYTILYVEDVAQTISFYERAFGFSKRFVTEDNRYGELDTGGTTISFASFEMAKENGLDIKNSPIPNLPFEIAFVTSNVKADFDKAVKAGAQSIKEPSQKPWGQLVGYVKDNNHFLIEICSPISP